MVHNNLLKIVKNHFMIEMGRFGEMTKLVEHWSKLNYIFKKRITNVDLK